MASYDEWNHALLSYFTEGIQRGTSVFLSVDEDVLYQIGHNLQLRAEDITKDFCQAIRRKIVLEDRINLNEVEGRNTDDKPQGLAFLAAMVLAASWMADSEAISNANYFKRLREVLSLPIEEGRPRGMDTGAEELLWQEWALWLQENGFLPSAHRGEGARIYIEYPISQALLRSADKVRLRKLFREKHWPQGWNVETLIHHIQRESIYLSQHLQNLLHSHGQHYQAAVEAIHEVYESYDFQHIDQVTTSTPALRTPHLTAELFRSEDPFSRQIQYYIYPHGPRRWHANQIQVSVSGDLFTLVEERPGWYAPMIPVTEETLNQGAKYKVEYPSDIDWLMFPDRQFWILIPDPDNPDSGSYASWGTPPLGTPFILLCKEGLVPQLMDLRNERLIEWKDNPQPLTNYGQWVEVQYCMVLEQAWSGVFIENQQLKEALVPHMSLSVSLSGGLRVPGLRAWIEGHGPQITIFGFDAEADVSIIRATDEHKISEQSQKTNIPFAFEWPGPGDYRIEATCISDTAEGLVKIVAWDQLSSSVVDLREKIALGTWSIIGAKIQATN